MENRRRIPAGIQRDGLYRRSQVNKRRKLCIRGRRRLPERVERPEEEAGCRGDKRSRPGPIKRLAELDNRSGRVKKFRSARVGLLRRQSEVMEGVAELSEDRDAVRGATARVCEFPRILTGR